MTSPLNLLDLVTTLFALNQGCYEMNPLMQNIPFMVFYKIVVVGVLCLWLSHRPERIARVGLNLCTVIYGDLCIYHFYGLLMIGGSI